MEIHDQAPIPGNRGEEEQGQSLEELGLRLVEEAGEYHLIRDYTVKPRSAKEITPGVYATSLNTLEEYSHFQGFPLEKIPPKEALRIGDLAGFAVDIAHDLENVLVSEGIPVNPNAMTATQEHVATLRAEFPEFPELLPQHILMGNIGGEEILTAMDVNTIYALGFRTFQNNRTVSYRVTIPRNPPKGQSSMDNFLNANPRNVFAEDHGNPPYTSLPLINKTNPANRNNEVGLAGRQYLRGLGKLAKHVATIAPKKS